VSLAVWRRSVGVSDTTTWRWVKAGWLHPVNIAGRPYLRADDREQFSRRAEAGEFAKPPRGAAAKSQNNPLKGA
jgi:predicted site-specific integrase-resolvase